MKIFRKIIFWTHLVVGVVAGVVIAIMCFTGVALAFEKEIVAWSDRDVRSIGLPGDAKTLSIDELIAKAAAANHAVKATAITIFTDPAAGVLVAAGRTNAVYVNQYTGAVTAPASPKIRAFLNVMIEWHRYLARSGDNRPRGKMITGACNLGFLFLAVSGLFLWWPRQWNVASLRRILVFTRGVSGKARDWNWHNVVGFWSAPFLIVLTATALPISYKWAGDAIYKLTRTAPPGQPPRAASGAATAPHAGEGSSDRESPTVAEIIAAVQKQIPTAGQIVIRPGGKGPLTLTVRDRKPRPRFATSTLTYDLKTGAVSKKETYADFNTGRKVRSWTRFLHTGEALGPLGQTLAGLASFGGLVLVWTGFALAIRRFLARKGPSAGAPG